MDPNEKEKQEKTLAKLQWLNERVKPDFKGNPSPFEARKTLRTVEQARRSRTRALAGDTDFLPFWRSTAPLALTATRCDYIVCDGVAQHGGRDAQQPSYGRQAVDPVTGMTQVQLALSWSVPHTSPTPPVPRRAADCGGSVGPATVVRDASYMRSLAPEERAAAYRQHILEHPKCTLESSRTHHDRWRDSTQLGEPIAKPSRRQRNTALDQKNTVRAVQILRSS